MNFYFKILYLKSLLISWNISLHSVEAKFSQRFTIQVQDGFSTAQNIANKHRKIIHFRPTSGLLLVRFRLLDFRYEYLVQGWIILQNGVGADTISRFIYFICSEIAIATLNNSETENCNFKTSRVGIQNSRSRSSRNSFKTKTRFHKSESKEKSIPFGWSR